MNNLIAIIFDVDGVLFDTEELSFKIWESIGKENGFVMDRSWFVDCLGLSKEDSKKVFKKNLGEDFDYDYYKVIKEKRVTNEIETNGIPLKAGVIKTLEYLKQMGYKLGVATSTSMKKTKSRFITAEIWDFFDENAIITGDMVQKRKT